ncbi:hypothetical protein [Streptomyces sp. MUSC 14]|uniref:hypothetical protein n=1 Tax=Streptomyces sp. MUSC 14 TaxID=1354889 RepID=UPI0011609CD2|nr:hypothetical protein [Streptomyces sp. MUSC 14]
MQSLLPLRRRVTPHFADLHDCGGRAVVVTAAAPRLLGARRAYTVTRWKNVLVSTPIYQFSRRRPKW